MSRCIHCDTDGTLSVITCDQRDVANRLGGGIGFVGALPEANIFIVGRRDTCLPVNRAYITHKILFHETARGPLILIGSDEDGEEIDVDVDNFYEIWNSATNS